MRYSDFASLADPEQAGQGRALRGHQRPGDASGVKCVTHLENPDTSAIFHRQQGATRHQDKNVIPTPRQVVTRYVGRLSIADIAVQHRVGNHWQWHRKKTNKLATVRTEEGAPKRPA